MNPIYNGVPITDISQLQQMIGINPTPLQQPQQGITLEQVNALIDERLKPVAPPTNPVIAEFESLIQRALTPEDYAEFSAYSASGAAGFGKVLSGDALYPVVQLFWETIRDNVK